MSARKLAVAAIALCACKQTAPAQAPQISSFTAQPAAIVAGESATLSWQVTGATTLTIDNGVGDVSGQTSAVVHPTADTTYTLTAKDGSSSSLATASVHVVAAGAAAASFKLEADASPVAGMPFHVRVTALDAQGHTVALYRGTVQLSSDDLVATPPAPAAFTSADAGVHDFTLKLATAGDRKLTAGDGSATGTATIHLAAGAAASMAVAGMPSQVTAGSAISLTVSLTDAHGNAASGYTGKLHFTSSDGHATLPADYTFTAADAGMHVFSVTFLTAGAQTVTAGDGSLSATTSSALVVAAAPAAIAFGSLPAEAMAGQPLSLGVTIEDAFGNVATGYTGTVHFTSTDLHATLPADYTFTGGDSGVHLFHVTFGTAGVQSATATDTAATALTGTSTAVQVVAGPAASIALALPSSATAGTAFSATATVKDAFGNVATGYNRTVHFASSDALASLPANYQYVAGDSGAHTFSVTLGTAGSQSVTVKDTATASIAGSGNVSISAGAATHFGVTIAASSTAGVAQSFNVKALDAEGNAATAYAGTIHFSSSDSAAMLPANSTLSSGAGMFSVTFKTAGSQSVTAADTVSSSITGIASSLVAAAGAAGCAMSGVPSSTTTDMAFSPKVTLSDSFGNVAAGYTGKVHFTSADTLATLPADYTYQAADAGAHTFTNGASFGTAGSQTLTATDMVNSVITCSGTSTVSSTATDHLVLSGLPASAAAGKLMGFTVTVKQGTVTDSAYRGTISFSSSDGAASLPANYAFTSGDAGTHSFSLTFETPGSQTVFAQDISNAAITGSGGPVTVHGLVYTDPTAAGRIRLVRNSAFNGSTAVLDLVAASSLTGYFVGLDLPLDASKVAANASPISAGAALNPGAAPQALAAALPATGPLAGIFVSGLSQKAAGAGAVTTDASISSGEVFYTLRLDLAAAASIGTVFDGASLPASFRAGLRNRAGNETAAAGDFAIGKLEVQ